MFGHAARVANTKRCLAPPSGTDWTIDDDIQRSEHPDLRTWISVLRGRHQRLPVVTGRHAGRRFI